MQVLIEPGMTVLIRHCQHAVVTLLAELEGWPGRNGANQHERQCCDLRAPAFQDKGDDQSDPTHRQAIDWQWIYQYVNVFRLP
jgi:hypothetical protein